MKKIAFLIPDYEEGGMPKVASNILMYLSQDKYKKFLIVLDSESKLKYPHDSEVIKIYPKGKSKPGKILTFIKRVKLIKNIKKEYEFDDVVSFGVSANIINILTKFGEKVICTEHNVKSIENKTWGIIGNIYDVLIKFFYGRADKLISISKVMKEDFRNNYNIKSEIEVIYNPHNINEIVDKSQELLRDEEQKLFDGKFTLINAGRLTYAKGHWHLIRIISELKKDYPNIQLLILGQGEMEKELLDLIEELNVKDSIKILGFKSNPYKYIKRSDLFVLSSMFEGFPNVLIESLACQTPIISTDCKSGPREIIDYKKDTSKIIENYEVHNIGILTPQFDGKVILNNQVLTNEELEMKKSIEKLIEDSSTLREMRSKCMKEAWKYDVSNIVKLYENTF